MITILVIDDDQQTKTTIETWQDDPAIAGKHRYIFACNDIDALKEIRAFPLTTESN